MIEIIAKLIADCDSRGGKVLICGNGGLAAEAEHFAAELMGKYGMDVFIPCISLTTNTSLITAIANDYGYEEVFAHQVDVLGKPGDILIGMTTSKSKNIIAALTTACLKDMDTVALCGRFKGFSVGHVVELPGDDTAEVQNHAIEFLHKVALEAKRLINDRSCACQS